MGPFDRGLLAIYSLAVSAVVVAGILMLTGVVALSEIVRYVSPEHTAFATGVLGVLLLAGLRLFGVSIRRRKKDGQAVIDDNSLGQVRVSLQALENLVVRVVSPVPGIREVRPRVGPAEGGVGISLKVVVSPEANVPELSRSIQQLVQDQVREVAGLTVSRVRVEIENFATTKGRVE